MQTLLAVSRMKIDLYRRVRRVEAGCGMQEQVTFVKDVVLAEWRWEKQAVRWRPNEDRSKHPGPKIFAGMRGRCREDSPLCIMTALQT